VFATYSVKDFLDTERHAFNASALFKVNHAATVKRGQDKPRVKIKISCKVLYNFFVCPEMFAFTAIIPAHHDRWLDGLGKPFQYFRRARGAVVIKQDHVRRETVCCGKHITFAYERQLGNRLATCGGKRQRFLCNEAANTYFHACCLN